MRVFRFWKPYGILTRFTDAEGRPTLADFIAIPGIYAAGRLDMDSEGLLLLTDDGGLAHRLTDPRFAHPRTYWAQVERLPGETALARLRSGVDLSEGGKPWRTRPAMAVLLDAPPDLPDRLVPIRYRANVPTAWIALTLTEGKNRQVRRMTAAVGHPTLRLVRWSIGAITLEGLEVGEIQPLSPLEIRQLQL
ncbi:MAG: pseudouridine synthase [Anaerolineae bacterium]|nr:pseudouridine synthase [Anaerolineae bacterium]NUQ06309.1 pseudouridine synthase [Anaerolineae bacterium]